MKLSWKDVVNTILVIAGGAVVYAKYYSYSWSVIASWRSAVAVLAIAGILMFAFSSFEFTNRSILNVSEMVLGVVAVVLIVYGVIVVSQFAFYAVATVLGLLWLIDTARHTRHSIIGGGTTYHHHAPVH